MKIGVISDTHDHMENITKAVKIFNERNIDVLIHCGDYVSAFTFRVFDDLNPNIKNNFYGVYGNNDGDKLFLHQILGQICHLVGMELISEFDGIRVYATHMPNKETVDSIAKSGNFEIILFGHTHSSVIEKYDNGVLVVNPGECCGYLSGKATIAIIDTHIIDAEIIEI
ncbi:MAG: metallophosphoesterase [Candidatus Lokiarchaeota archaeon]|nr:metallophosphoesterase [Candidatus Lokiarchaeota archaeon]